MFPNLQEVTDLARTTRAISRLRTCTTDVDLGRVWKNCQPLCKELRDKSLDGSQEATDLLYLLSNAHCDVREKL